MNAYAVLLAFVVACSAVDYYNFQCGNGIVEGSETCDDRNAATPGCGPTCQVEPGYECYYDNIAQRSVCSTKCGDGMVVAPETCDDLNLINGDGCSSSCLIENTHNCVTGPQFSVCTPKCGDGIISVGESCDGGALNTPTGCYHCHIFKGFTCDVDASSNPGPGNPSTQHCYGICGDGYQSTDEGCDDGNMNPYDTCGRDPTGNPWDYCTGSNRVTTTCSSSAKGTCVAHWWCPTGTALPTPPLVVNPTAPYSPCECRDASTNTPRFTVTTCGSGTKDDPLVCTDLGTNSNCAYCGHNCPWIDNACGPSTGYTDRDCYLNGAGNGYYCGCP